MLASTLTGGIKEDVSAFGILAMGLRGLLVATRSVAANSNVGSAPERFGFFRQTYLHVTASLAVFIVLEAALLQIPGVERLVRLMTIGWNWVIVAAAFIFLSYLAGRWSRREHTLGVQYLALVLYVAAEAVIFLPLVSYLNALGGPYVVPAAGVLSLVVFAGLTLTVLLRGRQLRPGQTALAGALWAAVGLVACGLLFEFNATVIIVAALVASAIGIILVESHRLGDFAGGQHVSATLAMLSSVGIGIWSAFQVLISAGQSDRSGGESGR